MKKNNIILVITIFLFTILIFGGCGDNTAKKETEAKAKVDENVVKLELTGDDRMQFNKSELRAKAGKKITLTLKHVGQMPITVMGHNFVLLKQGTSVSDFAQEAMLAKDNNYIPKNTDAIIAYTKMLGGGESDTITFDAPAVGIYDFICTFPGHYGIMNGKLIVE